MVERRYWTQAEIDELSRRYADELTERIAESLGRTVKQLYYKANQLGLKKSDAFMASSISGRIERLKQSQASVATRFKKGNPSWNQGLKGYQPGGRNIETRFKKGERRGAANRNYVPIGSLRVVHGILERKVNDTHPVPARRWVAVARLVWEAEHGPIPEGHVVVFKPGQRTTDEQMLTVDRLECISRAELAYRNHPARRYPPELAKLYQLKGAITRQVNRIAKEQTK